MAVKGFERLSRVEYDATVGALRALQGKPFQMSDAVEAVLTRLNGAKPRASVMHADNPSYLRVTRRIHRLVREGWLKVVDAGDARKNFRWYVVAKDPREWKPLWTVEPKTPKATPKTNGNGHTKFVGPSKATIEQVVADAVAKALGKPTPKVERDPFTYFWVQAELLDAISGADLAAMLAADFVTARGRGASAGTEAFEFFSTPKPIVNVGAWGRAGIPVLGTTKAHGLRDAERHVVASTTKGVQH